MAILLLTSPSGEVRRIHLTKLRLEIGRSVLNDVVIPDQAASRLHASMVISPDGGGTLRDFGSANGTFLNGARVTSATFAPTDTIRIGAHTLQFTGSEDSPAAYTSSGTLADLDQTIIATPLESIVNDTTVPRLAITTPGKTWEVSLNADVTVIGRADTCGVWIDSQKVSRKHAQIERNGDQFQLRDLGSRNGTWMSGRRIDRQSLDDGDSFTVGDARCVFKAGFKSEALTVFEQPAARRKRRPVVIVPGIMGSNLFLGSQQVWPNVRLMVTDPELFRYPGKVKLEPRGLVSEVVVVPNLIKQDQYNRLTEFLSDSLQYEAGNDLLEFAYDWRQDVRTSARELGAAIERWDPGAPVTIIAHSLGTLVTRYYVDCLGGARRVERVAFLGGPHRGVPRSVVALVEGPGILPFGILNERGRDVISTFPTTFQILPIYSVVKDRAGNPVDVLADHRWLPESLWPVHAIAREFRQQLPARCSVSSVCVFGYGLKTVTTVTIGRNGDGACIDVQFLSEESGDTAVPQFTSILEGTEIHPVRQHHGSLYTDKDVQMRLKLELTR